MPLPMKKFIAELLYAGEIRTVIEYETTTADPEYAKREYISRGVTEDFKYALLQVISITEVGTDQEKTNG